MRARCSLLSICIILGLAVLACNYPSSSRPSGPGALYTRAARTMNVQLTRQAELNLLTPTRNKVFAPGIYGQFPTSTPTIPLPPTDTWTPYPSNTPFPTLTPWPTPTPWPTFTPVPPTAVPLPCYQAQFVQDITAVDGSVVTPGMQFTKIWRLLNAGSCSWNSSFAILQVDGTAMSPQAATPLPHRVLPGEMVDVALNVIAPPRDGQYWAYYMMRSPDGVLFGMGPNADRPFWINLWVYTAPGSQTYSYDFAANLCQATWRTSASWLPCPGARSAGNGLVTLQSQPFLESGRAVDGLALLTIPQEVRDGWIVGVYPPYRVRENDHFIADLGCTANSTGCSVYFSLSYQVNNGQIVPLGQWYEVYDGRTTHVDVNLSQLAGQGVQFVLSVNNYSFYPGQANAFWLGTSIRGLQPSPTPLPSPTWTRTAPPPTVTNTYIPPTWTASPTFPIPPTPTFSPTPQLAPTRTATETEMPPLAPTASPSSTPNSNQAYIGPESQP